MNIYEKLGIIQSKLKAPKGQYNSFGKYKYRSCEDILEAVKPLLAETKTVLSVTDRMEVVGDRIYVRAEAHLNDCEDTRRNYNRCLCKGRRVKKRHGFFPGYRRSVILCKKVCAEWFVLH